MVSQLDERMSGVEESSDRSGPAIRNLGWSLDASVSALTAKSLATVAKLEERISSIEEQCSEAAAAAPLAAHSLAMVTQLEERMSAFEKKCIALPAVGEGDKMLETTECKPAKRPQPPVASSQRSPDAVVQQAGGNRDIHGSPSASRSPCADNRSASPHQKAIVDMLHNLFADSHRASAAPPRRASPGGKDLGSA